MPDGHEGEDDRESYPEGSGGEQQDEYNYGTPSDEEQKLRQGITDKFNSLSTEIDMSTSQIFNLLRVKFEKKGQIYARLTESQDEELFQELTKINVELGKASAMLDSYIRLTNSTPDFKNFFNKIYNIMVYIRNHRNTVFFKVNVRDNEQYLYPQLTLVTLLRELALLFGRLRGVLIIGGEFIKDQPPRPMAQPGMGGGGEFSPYNRPYFGGGGDGYSPYSGYGGLAPKPPEKQRDIGDAQDKV